jgi:hypothetical protein
MRDHDASERLRESGWAGMDGAAKWASRFRPIQPSEGFFFRFLFLFSFLFFSFHFLILILNSNVVVNFVLRLKISIKDISMKNIFIYI